MEIEIIHKECIKPSSPTPYHLRTYKVSLLDQLLPLEHVSGVFFYPFNPNNTTNSKQLFSTQDKIKRLKESLSATLTHFYPLAGRITDDDHLSVDCSDQGAYYIEARAKNLDLSTYLQNPDCQLMHKLFPFVDPAAASDDVAAGDGTFVFMFQVTIFDDGGIAFSVSGSHKIIDGTTFCTFLRAWTAAASSLPDSPNDDHVAIYPSFIAPSLYPQDPSLPKESTILYWPTVFKQGKCVTKRFVFDASAVTKLKEQSSSQLVQSPTRVEAVSAILWKCIMTASRTGHSSRRRSLLCQAANLRRRMSPPLPDHSVGNLIWTLAAECKADASCSDELDSLVSYIRESKGKLEKKVAKELQGDEGFSKVPKLLEELREMFSDENTDYIPIASWYHIGMYEADFGWGKPIWVSPGATDPHASHFTNMIYLMETTRGSGIEAWVSLDEQDMSILERDPLLLSFASFEPNPCQV